MKLPYPALRLTLAAVALASLTACSDESRGINSPDVPGPDVAAPDALADAADVADAPADQLAAPDVAAPPDGADAPDVTDAPADQPVAPDVADPTDRTDPPDVTVAPDVADPPDAVVPPDGADAPDVPADVRPPGCGADADCAGDPSGAVCDVTTRRCVRCLGARGCASGEACCAGACVDTSASASHCGACGSVCALPHATAGCTAGACTVAACVGARGDCDGAAPNGCEADTATSLTHCGACGRACAPARATGACVAGACRVERCEAGFGDCDANASNGCEAAVTADVSRCGACGTRCAAGQSCVAGGCVSDCRNPGALACASPLVCDYLTGACLDPARACVLSGTPVQCFGAGTPQACGPGTRCNAASMRCEPSPDCRRIVCDATGLCRGAECTLGGGGVRTLALEAPVVGAAGAAGGVRLRARVEAESLCGLNVGFELRREDGYYLSAGNDMGVWRVTTAGVRTLHLPRIGGVSGLAADRTGALHYVISRTGEVHRVTDVGGAVRDVVLARLTTGGRGVSRMTFGPDGQLYVANRTAVARVDDMGRVSPVVTLPAGAQDITGLAFSADGALMMLTISSGIYRLATGATAAALYVTPHTALGLSDFFGEALVLGPDATLYGSSFPSTNTLGVVFQVTAEPRVTRVLGLAEMQRDVPATRYAGVHGLAFGADGTLYFANQNTSGDTREAVAQLMARRPSGRIELVASGFNFDWPDGYDGDLVVAFVTLNSATGPLVADGTAEAALDVPAAPGTYEVRAFVTDPRTGNIRVVQRAITVR